MKNILIRNVPGDVLERLKMRASYHRRSLQQELLQILEEAAVYEIRGPLEAARAVRDQIRRTGRPQSDSTGLIRDDRSR